MGVSRVGRLAPAAVVLAGLGAACADAPLPSAPSGAAPSGLAAGSINTAAVAEGQLYVCKVGNAAGTFTVSYVLNADDGVGQISGSVNVDAGTCVLAVSVNTGVTGPSNRWFATLTETALPANWAFTSAAVIYSGAVSAMPVVDPVARSVSGVRLANDLGAEVTFTNTYTPPPPPPPGPSCTLTQGYWKNHGEDWDQVSDGKPFLTTSTFYNSRMSYLAILNTPPKGGNAYLQLAHQFIAAALNVNGGASGVAAVDAALSGAASYFAGAAAGTPAPSGALRTQVQAWATTLDNYNNGITGPGHCN